MSDDTSPELVEWSKAGLGGTFVEPPGHRDWSRQAVAREVRRSLGLDLGELDFEVEHPGFPAIRWLRVSTPAILATLPPVLGGRLGSSVLQLDGHPLLTVGESTVCVDRGEDLSDWRLLDWRDRRTGRPVAISTDPQDAPGCRVVESLAAKAAAYSRHSRVTPIDEVVVDSRLVAVRGRVSGVIDAQLAGVADADLAGVRPSYREPDGLGIVQVQAATEGYRAFARRTGLPESVAKRAAAGRPIAERNVRKALVVLRSGAPAADRACPICGALVTSRRTATYCSLTCRETARKRRQRAARRIEAVSAASDGFPRERWAGVDRDSAAFDVVAKLSESFKLDPGRLGRTRSFAGLVRDLLAQLDAEQIVSEVVEYGPLTGATFPYRVVANRLRWVAEDEQLRRRLATEHADARRSKLQTGATKRGRMLAGLVQSGTYDVADARNLLVREFPDPDAAGWAVAALEAHLPLSERTKG